MSDPKIITSAQWSATLSGGSKFRRTIAAAHGSRTEATITDRIRVASELYARKVAQPKATQVALAAPYGGFVTASDTKHLLAIGAAIRGTLDADGELALADMSPAESLARANDPVIRRFASSSRKSEARYTPEKEYALKGDVDLTELARLMDVADDAAKTPKGKGKGKAKGAGEGEGEGEGKTGSESAPAPAAPLSVPDRAALGIADIRRAVIGAPLPDVAAVLAMVDSLRADIVADSKRPAAPVAKTAPVGRPARRPVRKVS